MTDNAMAIHTACVTPPNTAGLEKTLDRRSACARAGRKACISCHKEWSNAVRIRYLRSLQRRRDRRPGAVLSAIAHDYANSRWLTHTHNCRDMETQLRLRLQALTSFWTWSKMSVFEQRGADLVYGLRFTKDQLRQKKMLDENDTEMVTLQAVEFVYHFDGLFKGFPALTYVMVHTFHEKRHKKLNLDLRLVIDDTVGETAPLHYFFLQLYNIHMDRKKADHPREKEKLHKDLMKHFMYGWDNMVKMVQELKAQRERAVKTTVES